MVRLIAITATVALLFTPSLALVLPEQAPPTPEQLAVIEAIGVHFKDVVPLHAPTYGNASTAAIEQSGHRLGKRQYASGSETPLWYTGKTDPWANFKSFNWNTWINWGWSDHTLGYVKEWYVDEYGLNLPPGVGSWQGLSYYVTYFGTRTPSPKPFVTVFGSPNTEDPWVIPSKQTTTTAKPVTTTSTSSTSSSKATTTSSTSTSASPSPSATTTPSATSSSKSSASSSSSSSTSTPAPTVAPSSSSSSSSSKPSSSSSSASSSSSSSSSSPSPVAASSPSSSSSTPAAVPSSSSSSAASSTSSSISSSSTSSLVASSSSSTASSSSTSTSSAPATATSSSSSSSSSSISSSATSTSSSVTTSMTTSTTSLADSTTTSSTSSAAPSPTLPAAPSGWAQASTPCIAEGTNGRALIGVYINNSTGQTVPQCLAECDRRGYPIGGLEYGSECWCSNFLTNSATLQKTGKCNMPCPGDSTTLCGGAFSLQLYVSTKFNSVGLSPDLTQAAVALPNGWQAAQVDNTTVSAAPTCIREVAGRALTGAYMASGSMTIQMCLNFCGSKGYQYSAVQYGKECRCGNELRNGASLSDTSKACGMSCGGDPTQSCGGNYVMNIYSNPAYSYSNTIVNGYVKTACIQEVVGRSLQGAGFQNTAMTVEMCTSYCSNKGFAISGVEYGVECYCSNQFNGEASLNLISDQCYMPCGGNEDQNCGGPNAIFVYINPNPPAVTSGLPSGWSSKGCIAEPNGGRALAFDATSQIRLADLTNELCAQTCMQLGYSISGAEYGSQCFCGNQLDNGASANGVNSNQCNYPCPGNQFTSCGGSYRLSLTSAVP